MWWFCHLPQPSNIVYNVRRKSQEGRPIMHRTLKAIIDEHGNIRLLETVPLPAGRRVLVTILEEEQLLPIDDVTLLSEAALADDWNRPEEDAAWSHLQPAR
jgi:hypothetical protein